MLQCTTSGRRWTIRLAIMVQFSDDYKFDASADAYLNGVSDCTAKRGPLSQQKFADMYDLRNQAKFC